MLVELLEKQAVPFETLHTRYGSLLALVGKLLGVVPNCDPYERRILGNSLVSGSAATFCPLSWNT